MRSTGFTALLTFLLVGVAVLASESQRTRIEIEVDEDGTGPIAIRFDSDVAGFNLHDLQLGESRAFNDESGRTSMVTRSETGYEFDIDGTKIRIGDIGRTDGHEFVHHNESDDVRVVKRIKKIRIAGDEPNDDVMIISGSRLDEATKQRIRDALSSSGHAGDVRFIDGHGDEANAMLHREMDSDHELHVITKEVDVTN